MLLKIILEHRNGPTTMRYSHLSPSFRHEAINQGSLFGPGTKTKTSGVEGPIPEKNDVMEAVERKENEGWLGDQESNLGSKIQNLMSCP